MAAAHASLRICAPCALAGASSSCFSSRVGQKLHLGAALKLKQCPAISVLSRRSSSVARAAVVELDELVERIKNMSLADCRSLTDKLQEELGVTAAAFAPVAAGGAVAPAEATPAVEEKTEFDVVLDEVPANARIAVIKVIRALTGLGLKESKDLIEGLPKNVKEGAGKEDAEDAKKQLEAAGAKCSLK